MVEQAETLVDAYYKEKERDAQGKKLAALKNQLDDLRNGVNFVIDAAKDPKGSAKDVAKKVKLHIRDAIVDEIVDGLLGGQKLKKEMAEIEARIAALNKRLEDLKLTGLNAGVSQASNTLSAEVQLTMKAQEALTKAKRGQGHAVDKLAIMEKNHPGTTTVFSELQQYYSGVQSESAEIMKSSKDYEKTMRDSAAALTYTADLRQAVRSDRAVMNELYPVGGGVYLEDEKQRVQTKAIVDYADNVDRWYKSKKIEDQLLEQRQFQDSLRGNQQYHYVSQLVDAIQADGLGDVQRDHPGSRTSHQPRRH